MPVEFFDSADDMFAAIARGVEQAKQRATPEQNAITYGDYWMRAWEDFLIFGYIDHPEALRASTLELGASEDEIEYEERVLKESYDNGFRFGKAYSVIEPDGELGDTHVSDMIKITKGQFEAAKALNWSWAEIADFNHRINKALARM
jgi:hypothetical protein